MMVFAFIQKHIYGKELIKAGMAKGSDSYDIAMNFALRFPLRSTEFVRSRLHWLAQLSYQNPNDFRAELEALADVSNNLKNLKWLEGGFSALERLTKTFGTSAQAGNILRALSGIEVEGDEYAEMICHYKEKIGGQRAGYLGSYISAPTTPEAFIAKFVYDQLIFSELGKDCFQNYDCFQHVAKLTTRSLDFKGYIERLEQVMKEYARDFYEDDTANIVFYGVPTVAFLAKEGEEKRALELIINFTEQASTLGGADKRSVSNYILTKIMYPLAISAKTVDEMQLGLDFMLETMKEVNSVSETIETEAKGLFFFYFLSDFDYLINSLDDLERVITVAKGFCFRLGASKVKVPSRYPMRIGLQKISVPEIQYSIEPYQILKEIAKTIPLEDIEELNKTLEQLIENLLQYPCHTGDVEVVEQSKEIIRTLSSTPAELINNLRLYGKLVNNISVGEKPLLSYLTLAQAVKEQEDSTEDECINALTTFEQKIKDTPEYYFRGGPTGGDWGAKVIWRDFLERNLLPELLQVSKAENFDVRIVLKTYEDTTTDLEGNKYPYIGIDSVKVEIIPR